MWSQLALSMSLVNIMKARYTEGGPHCPQHEDMSSMFTLQTNMKKNSTYSTLLTVTSGDNTRMVTVTCYHTTLTFCIQGAPNNVQVFIQDHIIKLFALTNQLHERLLDGISVTDLTQNTSLLCLSCQPGAMLESLSASPNTLPPTTPSSEVNAQVNTPTPTVNDISTLSSTVIDNLVEDSFSPPIDDASSIIPCGQPDPVNAFSVCELESATPCSESTTSCNFVTLTPRRKPTFKTKSKWLPKPHKHLTSTPVITSVETTRLDNLEDLVERLSERINSLENDNANLNSEISRLSGQLETNSKQCQCKCISQSPTSNSAKKRRKKNRQDETLPHNSPAYHQATDNLCSPLPSLSSMSSLRLSLSPLRPSAVTPCASPASVWETRASTEPSTSHQIPDEPVLGQPSIMVIGDSNLHGMKNMLHNAIPGAVVQPKSGATVASMRDDIVHSEYVDILVIAGGVNDADTRDKPEEVRGEIKHLIEAARQKAGTVILAPPAPNPSSSHVLNGIATITSIMEQEAACCGAEVCCLPIREFPTHSSARGRLYKDSLHLTKLGCGHYVKLLVTCLKNTYPALDASEEICVRCHHSGHIDCGHPREQHPPPVPRTTSPPFVDVSHPPPALSSRPPQLMDMEVRFPSFHSSIPWYRRSPYSCNYQTFMIPPVSQHTTGYWAPFL